ncbi:MAG: hypothetical protein ABGZ17_24280 [Planctomycetaceae bacterium]
MAGSCRTARTAGIQLATTLNTGAANSATTQGRKLASIRSFFQFMLREQWIGRDPTEGLPVPKTPRRPPRPLPVDDCHSLISHRDAKRSGKTGDPGSKEALEALRDRALVEFLYGTGIRVGVIHLCSRILECDNTKDQS